MQIKDTFFDNYVVGNLTLPTTLHRSHVEDWFRRQNILAGIASKEGDLLEFYVPFDYNDDDVTYGLVGILVDEGLEYTLTVEQLVNSLARTFGADVTIGEIGSFHADWSEKSPEGSQSQSNDSSSADTYVISHAKSDSALGFAKSTGVPMKYAKTDKWSIWRVNEEYNWYELGLLPNELPAYIIEDEMVTVQYKSLLPPIVLQREAPITLVQNIEELPESVRSKAQEILDYHNRPGGEVDQLIRRGVVASADRRVLIEAITTSGRSEYVRKITEVFGLPEFIVRHVVEQTMPESTQVATVSSWRKIIMKAVEEQYYEEDPDAGVLRRFAIYINRRPLLAWMWIAGELAVGGLLVYYFLVVPIDARPWWHIALGLLGGYLIVESLLDIMMRIHRSNR